MFVVTADQRGSRHGSDLVPAALSLLADVPVRLGFERTAGDEIQGVVEAARSVVQVVSELVRAGDWRLGIGLGPVEQPLPSSTRAARGPAFVAAREAVNRAARLPARLALVAPGQLPHSAQVVNSTQAAHPAQAAQAAQAARLAESALWLLAGVLRRRSPQGREIADLLAGGLSQREAARRLGVSESAVSQRIQHAGWAEQQRAEELALFHLEAADTAADPAPPAGPGASVAAMAGVRRRAVVAR